MAWNALGRWEDDRNRLQSGALAQQTQVMPEAQPVEQQSQELTGLLANGGSQLSTTSLLSGREARRAEREARRAERQSGPGGNPTPTPTPAPADQTPAPPLNPDNPLPAAPTPADASVANQLAGLLSSNSPYMKAAREAGLRQANSRGLLNSSIAAGNAEAAAIAAAAPIAGQDAGQIHQRNQTELEGYTNLRNAAFIQQMQDEGALERLSLEMANRLELQGMSDAAAMARLIKQGDIETAIAKMNADNNLTQTQINANVSLMNGYMNAFATLAANPELPASARNAYMAEFLRVTQSGQALVNALAGTEVTWPTSGTTPTTGTGSTGTGTGTTTGAGTGTGTGILSQLRVSV